jgi:hypothetical protein
MDVPQCTKNDTYADKTPIDSPIQVKIFYQKMHMM